MPDKKDFQVSKSHDKPEKKLIIFFFAVEYRSFRWRRRLITKARVWHFLRILSPTHTKTFKLHFPWLYLVTRPVSRQWRAIRMQLEPKTARISYNFMIIYQLSMISFGFHRFQVITWFVSIRLKKRQLLHNFWPAAEEEQNSKPVVKRQSYKSLNPSVNTGRAGNAIAFCLCLSQSMVIGTWCQSQGEPSVWQDK